MTTYLNSSSIMSILSSLTRFKCISSLILMTLVWDLWLEARCYLFKTQVSHIDSENSFSSRLLIEFTLMLMLMCYERTKAEQGWSPNQFASGLAQIWLRYDSDMAQHPFPSPTPFSFTNTLFTYITFFPCHKHIPFRPSTVSEHYINRSFCINLLLYS